jgi:hypothetical protein
MFAAEAGGNTARLNSIWSNARIIVIIIVVVVVDTVR